MQSSRRVLLRLWVPSLLVIRTAGRRPRAGPAARRSAFPPAVRGPAPISPRAAAASCRIPEPRVQHDGLDALL